MGKSDYVFSPASDLLFLFVAICMLTAVVMLLKTTSARILSVFILSAGFGSRILMGFSPTVWASGYRTFSILFVAFIFVAMIIADEQRKEVKT